ncbi:O-antigen ligase family protein [Sphingomonas sp.]|uniref:O-antigen ligase family protein n=1 Tax=Sphingomonas sp. TaxID=28214 RepID=UPI002D1FB0C1|nr:O-antigen ligase family protein [Sphingomonas sp.]
MTIKGAVLLFFAVHAFAYLLKREDADWVKGAPLKIFVGFYCIGMLCHVVWLFYLAIFLAIPLYAKSRGGAAALYAIVYVAAPVTFYKMTLHGSYLMPANKYLFATLGLMVAYLRNRDRGPKPRLLAHFDISMMIIVVLEISQARDPDLNLMTRQLIPILLNIVLPYYFLSRALTSWEDVRKFMLALALGGFVLAVVATCEAHLHWLLYKQLEANLHATAQTNAFQQVRGGMIRSPVTFPESTSLGNFLALGGVAMLTMRSAFPTKQKWYFACAVMIVGLIAPNSRGAYFGIIIGYLAFDFYVKKWGPLFVKFAVVTALYTVGLVAASHSQFVAEMMGKGNASRGSTDYRVRLFARGMEEIHKHPMLGTTMKKALDNLEDMRQGQHIIDLVNGYISYGLTLGYMGIIGLAGVFVTMCLAMLAARPRFNTNPIGRNAGALVFSVALFMIPVIAFTSFGGETSTYFYIICALGSAVWALRRVPVQQAGGEMAPAVAGPPIRALILADREAARARRNAANVHGTLEAG